MSAAQITALILGAPALIGAITALIATIMHARDPDAHQPGNPAPPKAPGT